MGSPKILIFGESGGTVAFMSPSDIRCDRVAEREEIFDVLNELEVRLRSVDLGLRWRILLHEQIEKLSSQCKNVRG